MTPDFDQLRALAATNEWIRLWPELALAASALLILPLELLLGSARKHRVAEIALAFQALILAVFTIHIAAGQSFMDFTSDRQLFGGLIEQNSTNLWMRVFFLACGLVVTHLGWISLRRRSLPQAEFFHILLVITAALMLLVQSSHFLMLFIALETVTIGFYILVSYHRTSGASIEAGTKYLIQGALSSAILLFGIVLLYGAGGNPSLPGHSADPMLFANISDFIRLNPHNLIALTGIVMVLVGLGFKIAAVPTQIWVGDVYQGAPTPVTAFLAVASKAAGFIVLLTLVQGPLAGAQHLVEPLLTASAVATILFGNLAALGQKNVKRLMGMSGIAHAGYLLLGVIASFHTPSGTQAVLLYLFVYLFASFLVFSVMAHMSGEDDALQNINDYRLLYERSPFLGGMLCLGLGSLAGIPPLAGFIGKLFIFIAAYRAGLEGLLFVAIAGVVISIGYYFYWMRTALFRDDQEDLPLEAKIPVPQVPDFLARNMMTLLAALSVLVGIFPALLAFLK